MKNRQEEKRIITRLVLPFLGIVLAWFFLYEILLKPSGFPDNILTRITAQSGEQVLNWLGYEASTIVHQGSVLLSLNNSAVLQIAHECNGLILLVLFSALLFFLPGKSAFKALYWLIGSVVIFVANVIRVAALSIIFWYSPEFLDFNHKYTFTIIVYAIIFMLWTGWGKFQKKLSQKKESTEKLQLH